MLTRCSEIALWFTVSDARYAGDTIPGFPQHPHRGFETLTATLAGVIDHTDSLGNAGRYGGYGDLQWMTAGRGVVHGEVSEQLMRLALLLRPVLLPLLPIVVSCLIVTNRRSRRQNFPLIHTDKGNPLRLFQIWLNLPARSSDQSDLEWLWRGFPF